MCTACHRRREVRGLSSEQLFRALGDVLSWEELLSGFSEFTADALRRFLAVSPDSQLEMSPGSASGRSVDAGHGWEAGERLPDLSGAFPRMWPFLLLSMGCRECLFTAQEERGTHSLVCSWSGEIVWVFMAPWLDFEVKPLRREPRGDLQKLGAREVPLSVGPTPVLVLLCPSCAWGTGLCSASRVPGAVTCAPHRGFADHEDLGGREDPEMLSLTTDKSEIISALRKVCVRGSCAPHPHRMCAAERRPRGSHRVGRLTVLVADWTFHAKGGTTCPCFLGVYTERAGVCSSTNCSEPSSGSWGSSHRIGLVFSKESNLPQIHLLTRQVWGPHAAPTWAAGTRVLRGCVPRAPRVPVCLAQRGKGPGIRVPLHPTGGGTDSLQPRSSFPSGAQKHVQS